MTARLPLHLLLPWPPANNVYYRHVGSKTLLSEAGRDYKDAVLIAFRQQVTTYHEPYAGRLYVNIVAHPPDQRRRDLDGLFKAPLDALTHARVWEDDSLIDELRIERGTVQSPGSLSVRITAL